MGIANWRVEEVRIPHERDLLVWEGRGTRVPPIDLLKQQHLHVPESHGRTRLRRTPRGLQVERWEGVMVRGGLESGVGQR